MGDLGLRPAVPAEMPAVHAMAVARIGVNVASAACLKRVQDRADGGAIFVNGRGAVANDFDAFMAVLPLSAEGLNAVSAGRLDGLSPRPCELQPLAMARALYVWGVAACSLAGSAPVLRGVSALRDEVFPHLPFFARAASARGLHVLTRRLGYAPFDGVPGLLWSSPLAPMERAA